MEGIGTTEAVTVMLRAEYKLYVSGSGTHSYLDLRGVKRVCCLLFLLKLAEAASSYVQKSAVLSFILANGEQYGTHLLLAIRFMQFVICFQTLTRK